MVAGGGSGAAAAAAASAGGGGQTRLKELHDVPSTFWHCQGFLITFASPKYSSHDSIRKEIDRCVLLGTWNDDLCKEYTKS